MWSDPFVKEAYTGLQEKKKKKWSKITINMTLGSYAKTHKHIASFLSSTISFVQFSIRVISCYSRATFRLHCILGTTLSYSKGDKYVLKILFLQSSLEVLVFIFCLHIFSRVAHL